MMAASAISGVCNLAPPNLPNHRERDVLLSRMLKHGRSFDPTSEVHQMEQHRAHSDLNPKGRICTCGMENTSSHGASTSGQSGRVLFAGTPPSTSRKLQKKLSMKKLGKKSSTRVSALRPVRCRNVSMSLEKAPKQHLHQLSPSEKWGMDLHVDGTENTRRQKRRAALAAFAVAGYVSILLPSSASAAAALTVDFPAPTTTIEALEAQFKGSTRKELERGIQIQRNEWEMANVATTAPSPTQTPQSPNNAALSTQAVGVVPLDVEEDSFYAWKQVQKEMGVQEAVCVLPGDVEDDSFYAWKQVEKEMGYEGAPEVGCISPAMLQSMEDDPFYAWRQIQKEMAPVPKSPVKKAVAASVAVAVAGSVAGAASAAGRAVASSGGTSVVATSLTVLQHSALPGSTLLAKIAQHLGGGGVAGAIGATAVYPLDTIKTRMQAQSLVYVIIYNFAVLDAALLCDFLEWNFL